LEEATRSKQSRSSEWARRQVLGREVSTPEEVRPRAASGAERRVGHWAACCSCMGTAFGADRWRGPAHPTGSPELRVTVGAALSICTIACRATQTVTPREVLAKRLFSGGGRSRWHSPSSASSEMALSEVRRRLRHRRRTALCGQADQRGLQLCPRSSCAWVSAPRMPWRKRATGFGVLTTG